MQKTACPDRDVNPCPSDKDSIAHRTEFEEFAFTFTLVIYLFLQIGVRYV